MWETFRLVCQVTFLWPWTPFGCVWRAKTEEENVLGFFCKHIHIHVAQNMHVSSLAEIQRCEGTGTMILLTPTVDLRLCFLNHISLLNQCGQFLVPLTPSSPPPPIVPPATLNEPPDWLTGLHTFPIKVNKIVLSPVSHMTLPLTKLRRSFA